MKDESFFNMWLKMTSSFYLVLKMAFSFYLVASEWNVIFYWVAHLLILSKSLLRLFSKFWMSCITENKNTSSAKSFALDERPSVRSLM